MVRCYQLQTGIFNKIHYADIAGLDLGPIRSRRFVGYSFAGFGVIEFDLPCVQTHRRIVNGQRLLGHLIGIVWIGVYVVRRIALDWKTQIRKVYSDLICPAGLGATNDQRRPIVGPINHFERRRSRLAVVADGASAHGRGFGRNGLVTLKSVFRTMAGNSR